MPAQFPEDRSERAMDRTRERIELAENFYGRTDAASPRPRMKSTWALMASSYRGVKVIARRYVSDPNFRARIAAVVETLPAERQRLFVGNVKRRCGDQQAPPRSSRGGNI